MGDNLRNIPTFPKKKNHQNRPYLSELFRKATNRQAKATNHITILADLINKTTVLNLLKRFHEELYI